MTFLALWHLREDLEVSHKAVSHRMDILDRLYYVIRVPPFTSSKVRSLRKMPKAYLWDGSLVPSPGPESASFPPTASGALV
jgi:predicted AAA+ superfamily ATPase